MPKRKSAGSSSTQPRAPLSLASFDAALDLLACETFTRLEGIKSKFEDAAGFDIDETAVRGRWEEAVKRYWVMKSMDDLCCGASPVRDRERDRDRGKGKGYGQVEGEDGQGNGDEQMDGDGGCAISGTASSSNGAGAGVSVKREDGKDGQANGVDEHGRAVVKPHPGAVALHDLNAEEEHEWRKWVPRMGDVVLVDTPTDGLWPGKIIDKKVFFVGRTQPKGNHFFAVRIYNPNMEPTLSIKSRLLPLNLRPIAPLLSPSALLSAYNHATCSDSFDLAAQEREYAAADRRAHPGLTDPQAIKSAKAEWNGFVNWVMNERRAEKLRNLAEERERRLRMMAVSECREYAGVGSRDGSSGGVGGGTRGPGGAGAYGGGGNQGGSSREKTFRVLAPSAFSSPARPTGRETEMTDMSTNRRSGDRDIDLDGCSNGKGTGNVNRNRDGDGDRDRDIDPAEAQGGKRQRRSSLPLPPADLAPKSSFPYTSTSFSNSRPLTSTTGSGGLGIFNVPPVSANSTSTSSAASSTGLSLTSTSTPRRTSSPFRLRPGLGPLTSASLTTPTRPLSPRRMEKRRGSGIMSAAAGYESPRRGSWTPPRILPSGDETAPFRRFSGGGTGMNTSMGMGIGMDGEDKDAGSGGGGMWARSFDFVSPLGPVRAGVIDATSAGVGGFRNGPGTGSLLVNGRANGETGAHAHGADGDDASMEDDQGERGQRTPSRRGVDTPHVNVLPLGTDDTSRDLNGSSAYGAGPDSKADMQGSTSILARRHSECLEVVREEEEEGDWTFVGSANSSRKMNGANGQYDTRAHSNGDNSGDGTANSHTNGDNKDIRERGSSLPCPETPVSKGKSVMHVKDKRQRELMMTPTRSSSSVTASMAASAGTNGDARGLGVQSYGTIGHAELGGGAGANLGRLLAGVAIDADEDVEL